MNWYLVSFDSAKTYAPLGAHIDKRLVGVYNWRRVNRNRPALPKRW